MFNPWIACEYLKDKLEAEKTDTKEVPRGIIDNIRKHSNNKYTDIKYKTSV